MPWAAWHRSDGAGGKQTVSHNVSIIKHCYFHHPKNFFPVASTQWLLRAWEAVTAKRALPFVSFNHCNHCMMSCLLQQILLGQASQRHLIQQQYVYSHYGIWPTSYITSNCYSMNDSSCYSLCKDNLWKEHTEFTIKHACSDIFSLLPLS